jgi:hypothetical protein
VFIIHAGLLYGDNWASASEVPKIKRGRGARFKLTAAVLRNR